MQSWSENALQLLKEAGHPLTGPRREVIAYLEGNETHPTAAQVVEAVPEASRAAVYRVLGLLVEQGICDAVTSPSGEVRYDPRTSAHDHFFCRRCGILWDIGAANVDASLPDGFVTTRTRVTLEGTCASCAES